MFRDEDKPYPKLMKSSLTGIEVLFSEPKIGVVVAGNEETGSKIGKQYFSFVMDYFYDI